MESVYRENRSDNLIDKNPLKKENTLKTLSDIVSDVHKNEATGLTKEQINAVAKAVVAGIAGALGNSEEVSLNGFGKFTPVDRAERMGRNPQTGEQQLIKASRSVKFKASKALKDQVA